MTEFYYTFFSAACAAAHSPGVFDCSLFTFSAACAAAHLTLIVSTASRHFSAACAAAHSARRRPVRLSHFSAACAAAHKKRKRKGPPFSFSAACAAAHRDVSTLSSCISCRFIDLRFITFVFIEYRKLLLYLDYILTCFLKGREGDSRYISFF